MSHGSTEKTDGSYSSSNPRPPPGTHEKAPQEVSPEINISRVRQAIVGRKRPARRTTPDGGEERSGEQIRPNSADTSGPPSREKEDSPRFEIVVEGSGTDRQTDEYTRAEREREREWITIEPSLHSPGRNSLHSVTQPPDPIVVIHAPTQEDEKSQEDEESRYRIENFWPHELATLERLRRRQFLLHHYIRYRPARLLALRVLRAWDFTLGYVMSAWTQYQDLTNWLFSPIPVAWYPFNDPTYNRSTIFHRSIFMVIL